MIKAWWHYSDNFGDCLTPYLLNKITQKEVKYTNPSELESDIYCLTGSLLNEDLSGCNILGLGSAFPDFSLKCSPKTNFLSIRGPLTKEIVEKQGYKVEMVGDGAFLLPIVYNPKIDKQFKLGIMQSWVDIELVRSMYGEEKEVLIIDMMRPVETVINDILKCELTISGCLHGLITSMIYKIPSYHVKLSNKMMGNGFKFEDFKKSVNYEHKELPLAEKVAISELIKLPFLPDSYSDIDNVQKQLYSKIKNS
ncbi:putative Polysaccharide pyruvyl transferase [Azospirillaceae bacterium]